MFFTEKSNFPIGIDISDLGLKLVQLKKAGDKIKIQAINKASLSPGIFEKGEIINKEKAIKALSEIIEKPKYGKITSREVVACLPETKTFIKLIDVFKATDDFAKAVESEIEKHVPIPLTDIYYDWQVIEDLPDKQRILIGAAPKIIVNQYTELLDKAGLTISALEIEPVSICRCLLAEENNKFKGERNKNYAIIDVGAKRSSITFYSKNTILFSFSLPISGEEITKKIADSLQIDEEQAEKAKIICGLDENKAQGIIKNILIGTIKDLAGKINETIMFFNFHFQDRGKLDEIILTGGWANIKNLNIIINDYVNIKVGIGNVLINLNEDKEKIANYFSETHILDKKISAKDKSGAKLTQDSSNGYSTAFGLALRGIFINKL